MATGSGKASRLASEASGIAQRDQADAERRARMQRERAQMLFARQQRATLGGGFLTSGQRMGETLG